MPDGICAGLHQMLNGSFTVNLWVQYHRDPRLACCYVPCDVIFTFLLCFLLPTEARRRQICAFI